MDAEVAVIGTGTMGSMTLWNLARAGIAAIGFEQYTLGHDRSAAGGESRIFRVAYREGPQYVPMLLRARDLWRELEAEAGRDLLTVTGGLMIGDAASDTLRNVVACAERFRLPHDVLDAEAMAARYPQHRSLLPGEIAVLDRMAGVIRPEFAVLSACRRAQDLGAAIYERTQVTAVEPDADGVTVRAAGREYRVRQAVVAAGPWTARFAPGLAPHITARRVVMTWHMASDPAAYQPGRFPISIRHSEGVHISAFPSLDGGSVKIAVSASFTDLAGPDDLDRNVDPGILTVVTDAVARFLPGLVPGPIRVSAYMDGYTPDGHALVGPLPATPNVWLLGGFSGHGFKLSPAIGQAAADLICHGETDLPIAYLDPARWRDQAAPEGRSAH
jgi:sarcosine oxidase